MSTSPVKESIAKLFPQTNTTLLEPPSPRTHRALRRLQSAHSLGQANSQPSLISQQHKQAIQRAQTPPDTSTSHFSRGRSNSDATNMTPPTLGAAGKRSISNKRPIAADALSLDRLIREGPPDGDLVGALDSTRLKILGQGIKSDSDGMVRTKYLIRKLALTHDSHLCEYTSGLSFLMRQSSTPTTTLRLSTAVLPQPTPRSETTPFEP
jgi:cell cycle arrest protein BUB2